MRIKAKQGWNVHIPDMNLSLQSGRDFIEVDEKAFNNSMDARRVKDLIEIDDGSSKPKKKLTPKKPVYIEQVGATSFVVQNSDQPKQSNAIVYDPNNEADLKTVQSKQNLDAEASKRTQKETIKNATHYDATPKIAKEEVKTEEPKVIEAKANEVKINEAKTETVVKEEVKVEPAKVEVKPEVKSENTNQVNDDSSKTKDNKKSKKK